MKRRLGQLKDSPRATALVLAVLVAAHRLFYDTGSLLPDVAAAMAESELAPSIYLGFAAIVAVIAGFAGVIIIFALSSTSPSFSRMRAKGGAQLRANWISPIATALIAAFGSGLCAVLWVAELGTLAWWVFEFLCLLAASAAIRLVWIFKRLISIVADDDHKAEESRNAPRSLAEVKRGRRAN